MGRFQQELERKYAKNTLPAEDGKDESESRQSFIKKKIFLAPSWGITHKFI